MSAATARLFVALALPDPVRRELRRWGGAQRSAAGRARLLDPDSMHVTLCFLGSHPEDEVEEITAACRSVAGLPAAPSRLGAALWLPVRRPRVLAVELADDNGRLATVQAALSDALSAGGWYAPERRRFLPHVTVLRVSSLRAAPPAPEPPAPFEFVAAEVVLYRSHLSPSGARYEPLERVQLTA